MNAHKTWMSEKGDVTWEKIRTPFVKNEVDYQGIRRLAFIGRINPIGFIQTLAASIDNPPKHVKDGQIRLD